MRNYLTWTIKFESWWPDAVRGYHETVYNCWIHWNNIYWKTFQFLWNTFFTGCCWKHILCAFLLTSYVCTVTKSVIRDACPWVVPENMLTFYVLKIFSLVDYQCIQLALHFVSLPTVLLSLQGSFVIKIKGPEGWYWAPDQVSNLVIGICF